MNPARRVVSTVLVALLVLIAGCATAPPIPPGAAAETAGPAPLAVLRSLAIEPALEERILALDPDRITEADVRDTLSKGPTPRIVLVHGGIFPVHLAMVSFGHFLTEMGYPENRIRHPGDRRWSHSPYEDGAQIAGLLAWYYEHDGMRPLVVGHSQGGAETVKVLYDLAGKLGDAISVWNPYTDAAERRTTFTDPLTGKERPVVGLVLPYASVVGAGSAALLLPNQWVMVGRLHTVPDSVEDFTGFSIEGDPFALLPPGVDEKHAFRPNGTANVRNVLLPWTSSHVLLPVTRSLAEKPDVRAWISGYRPDGTDVKPPDGEGSTLWAADIWFSVRKHWAQEAQRLILARRAALGTH